MYANITIDDKAVTEAIDRLVKDGGNLSQVGKQIGEYLVFSTKRRFQTSTGPDGTPWKENSEVSMLRYLSKTKGSFKKNGSLSKRGQSRAGNKKPLIGETRSLSTTIHYNVRTGRVEVGTPMIYGGVQQFGAKQGAFGKNKRGTPIPWGDIPARPYLGLSAADRTELLAIINDHHERLLKP